MTDRAGHKVDKVDGLPIMSSMIILSRGKHLKVIKL